MKLILSIVLMLTCVLCSAQEAQPIDSALVKDLDEMPQFVGGSRSWQKFVTGQMNLFPIIEQMDSTQYVDFGAKQTAILEFTVCEDGEVCDIKILNKSKISPAYAKEAMRVMKKSPKWKPGVKNNQTVKTRFRQPIVAILEYK